VLEDLRARSSEYLDAAEEIEERWNEPAVTEHEVSIVKRFDTVLNRAKTLVGEAETQVQFAGHVDRSGRWPTNPPPPTIEGSPSSSVSGPTTTGERYRTKVNSPASAPRPGIGTFRRRSSSSSTGRRRVSAPNQGSTNEYGVLVSDRTYTFVFHWFFPHCALGELGDGLHGTDGGFDADVRGHPVLRP